MMRDPLRCIYDRQSPVDVLYKPTPPEHTALVFLHTAYTSVVSRRPCAECAIPIFVDTTWPARTLVRRCHAQAKHAHGSFRDSKCNIVLSTTSCFVADAYTGNPLLLGTARPLETDARLAEAGDELVVPTLDGSHGPPCGDPILDVSIGHLLACKYLRAIEIGDSGAHDRAAVLNSIMVAARTTKHAPPMCASVAYLSKARCSTNSPMCACSACCGARLYETCRAMHPTSSKCAPNCWCLFEAALQRTSIVLHLTVVPTNYDMTSEQFGETVFDVDAPLVQRYLDALNETTPGMRERVEMQYIKRRQIATIRMVAPPGVPHKPGAPMNYDEFRRHLGITSTVSAHLFVAGALKNRAVLDSAESWVVNPTRHYMRVGANELPSHLARLRAIFEANCGMLLSENCERMICAELVREPNRTMAINRILAFLPGVPTFSRSDRRSYSLEQHDDVVAFTLLLVHIATALEKARQNAQTLDDVLGGNRFSFDSLVSEACEAHKAVGFLRWNDVNFGRQ